MKQKASDQNQHPYRYHFSDSEPEHDDLDSIVMVDKTYHQIKVQHLNRVKGKQVRLGSTGPAGFGIHLGIKNPDPGCIVQDNRWFYGEIALINKKHSPKFSLYEEPYFPAVVVGSHKGNLVLVGKCSDDKTETYTGELLTVPGSVAIHVHNFCIGHVFLSLETLMVFKAWSLSESVVVLLPSNSEVETCVLFLSKQREHDK